MKVLIIDDDDATTEMLSLILSQLGVEILTAHNGAEGVQKSRNYSPDLIILDMMMPVMDGMETCKAIRLFSQTPIMMLSALDNPCLVADLLNAGADDYLIKPAGMMMLSARVRKLLRIPAPLPLELNV